MTNGPHSLRLVCGIWIWMLAATPSCVRPHTNHDVEQPLQNTPLNKDRDQASTINACGVSSSVKTIPAPNISKVGSTELVVGADGCPHVVYRPLPAGSKLELASFDGERWNKESIPNSMGAYSLDMWVEDNGQVVIAWSDPKEKVVRLGVRRAPNDWVVQDILNDWIWNIQHLETSWHDRALMVLRSDEQRSIRNGRIHMLVEDDQVWSMHPIADDVYPLNAFATKQLALDPVTGRAIIFLSSYYVPSKTKHLGNLWIARSARGSLTGWKAERAPPTGLNRDKILAGHIDRTGLTHIFAKESGSYGLGTRGGLIYHLSGSPSQGWTIKPLPGCDPGVCHVYSIHGTAQGFLDVFYGYREKRSSRDSMLMWARYDGQRWRTAMIEPIADQYITSVAYESDSEDTVHVLLRQNFQSPTHHTLLVHRLLSVSEFGRENTEERK